MEDIVFEETNVRNAKMEEVLEKTVDFNTRYIELLKSKLEEAKKMRDEITNG